MNPLDWGPWLYGKFFAHHHPFWGYLFACGVAVFVALVAWTQIKDKYEAEHPSVNPSLPPALPKKPMEVTETNPFSVVVEWAMVSYGGEEFGTPFWVRYRSRAGCSISQAQLVLFIRVKNLRNIPLTISGYGIDAGFPLVRLPTESVFSLMAKGKSLLGAKIGDVVNFSQGPGFSLVHFPKKDNDLVNAQLLELETIDTLLNKPLEPNLPIRGWAFFEYRGKEFSMAGPVKIHIKTDDGQTSSYDADLKNPEPEWDVLKRPMKVVSVVDLSNCEQKPYYVKP